MIDSFEQQSLFDRMATVRAATIKEVCESTLVFRERVDPAIADRAAFVRHHVDQIVKKGKTSASHRSRGKTLLEKSEATGDTGAGEEARAEYEMAARADALVEQHIAALITRTT